MAAVPMAGKKHRTRIVGLQLDPHEIKIYVPTSNTHRFKTIVCAVDSFISLLGGIDIALGYMVKHSLRPGPATPFTQMAEQIAATERRELCETSGSCNKT